jgi:hypothetical protein
MLATSCKPTETLSYSDNAELTFVRSTPEQLQFRISNHSQNVVRFRGIRGDELGSDPWDFLMECKSAAAVDWDVKTPTITDGNIIDLEVAPGEQLLIRVSGDFAKNYKKGRCRATLWLRDRTELKSDEFEPQR